MLYGYVINRINLRTSKYASPSNRADLSCQHIKSLCKRHLIFFCTDHLTFVNHVHQFDICHYVSDRAKGIKIEHRSGQPFDDAMILFDGGVERFYLTNHDRTPLPALISSVAALLAPYLSIVTFSRISCMALSKKRMAAAALSRLSLNRKSIVYPCLSTTR